MAEAWLTEKSGKQTELVHKAERIVPASVPHGQSAIGFSSSQEVQGWIDLYLIYLLRMVANRTTTILNVVDYQREKRVLEVLKPEITYSGQESSNVTAVRQY